MKYNFEEDNFEILLFPKDLENKKVRFNSIPRRKNINHKVHEIIEAEWDSYAASQIAVEKHDYLTNTSLFRYEGYKTVDSVITINVSQTDYKEVYGTNIKNPQIYHEFWNDYLGNALGICCLINTNDNKYLLFKRSDTVLELPGFYHTCAGHIERGKDTIEKFTDIFVAMQREIAEEISIYQNQISAIESIGLCKSLLSFKPEMLFSCKVNTSSKDFSQDQLNFEHKSGFFLKKKN